MQRVLLRSAYRAARTHQSIRTMATAAPITAPAGTITLSDTEEKFVTLLDEFAMGYNTPIECRIAGGWVRDKLLALPSHDLDVALSTASGYAFAEAFHSFLKGRGVDIGSLGRIEANPEQSKHLETGTTRIMGLECDFVGLRSETYTDTRIPQIQLGTPLEDALRRDLTCNSLFFNVHSREIEDWTRYGLEDLKSRIARTPLPPRQTFLDDPLRVLRCVRFAGRFGLRIQPDVSAAMKEEDIQDALRTKVSKERVGEETHKMMQKTPLRAYELIYELGLHRAIFTGPVDPEFPREQALAAAQVLDEVLKRTDEQGSDALWFAAGCSPFRGMTREEKGKTVSCVVTTMLESVKRSADLSKHVAHLFEGAGLLDPAATGRSQIGLVLQNPTVRPWAQTWVWAIVLEVLPTWAGKWEHDATLEKWAKFRTHLESLGLPKAIEEPPLINGKEIQALLQIRPGQIVGVLSKAVMEWQLDHPGSTREQCSAWLKEEWEGEQRPKWEAMVPPPVNKTGKKRKT